MNNLPDRKFVPIGEAAKLLGVSIDTLRRWDKSGKISSFRPDGKNRFFKISDIERLNNEGNDALSISEAAKLLKISSSTLRRYEKKGLLKPARNPKGDRVYSRKSLEDFQKPKRSEIERKPTPQTPPEQVFVPMQPKAERNWQYPSSFLVVVLLLTTMLSTLYVRDKYERNQEEIRVTASRVLGASDQGGILGFFGKIGSFFGNTTRRVLEQNRIALFGGGIINVNEIFEYDEEGNIVPKVSINITQPELLKIKETVTVIQNLDAETLQGSKPGTGEGNIPVFSSGGRITGLFVSSANLLSGSVSGGVGGIILDGSITVEDIADGAVTGSKILNDTIKNEDIADGAINSGKIEDGSITGTDIGDGAVGGSELSGILTWANGDFLDLSAITHSSTSKMGLILPNVSSASPFSPISGEGYLTYDTAGDQVLVYDGSSWVGIGGSVTLATDGGLTYVSEQLSLSTSCADTQVLKWNDTSEIWYCDNDSGAAGAGVSTIRESDGTPSVVSATILEFGPATTSEDEFVITDQGGGTARVVLGSKVAHINATETVSGAWSFSSGTTFTGGITANDASVDSILLGHNSATPDIVTIAGNVSITDTHWSIAADGSTTGLSGITADGLSCTNCIGATQISDLTLGTDTAGDYVASVTNGSGISGGDGGSEGAGLTLALGALTTDWNQTGTSDIVLNNTSSELKILESGLTPTLFGILDVGDLSTADSIFTFSGSSGTVVTDFNAATELSTWDQDSSDDLTTSNYTTTLDSVYVNAGESPVGGDIAGSFSGGLTINSGAVAAAELAAVITWADGDLVDFSSMTPNTATEGLKLVQSADCSAQTAEGLVCWDSDNDTLYIGNSTGVTEVGSGGGGSVTLRESDTSPSVSSVTTIEFGPATTSEDEFIVTDQTGGVARIEIGNKVGKLNEAETVTSAWIFNAGLSLAAGQAIAPSSAGGLTIGSGSLTALTVTTDGTGDAEVALPTNSIGSGEILDNTVSATDLAATITLADGDLIDFSSIVPNTTTEGLKLVQSIDCSAQTVEGLICWDSDNEKLYVGNGVGVTEINSSAGASTLQQAYEAGNTISVNTTEGNLALTLASADFSVDAVGLGADVIFEIGQGTDQGDFRIWDGTTNWLFIDESGDTLAFGAAAGSGITIGGAGVGSVTVTTDGAGDAEVALPTNSIGSGEILDNAVSATDLAAIITLADGDLIDFSSITPNTITEGLKLVQNADCSAQTAEGLICWDSDNEKLYVGNGAGVTEINSSAGASTLQQAYEAGETISVNSTEGNLALTLASADFSVDAVGLGADVNFEIGQGTDQGDFRIWDGVTDWFFIDESGDTLALGAAAGSGITIGGGTVGSVTISTDGTGDAEVVLPVGSISGTEILNDTVALTTDTSGNYVAGATANEGLTLTGTEGGTLGIQLTASGTTGSSTSNSGLEVGSAGLTLLKGCTDNYILKYTDAGGWACAVDGGGGGGAWSDLTDPTAALALTFDDTEVNTFTFSHTVGDQNFFAFDVNQVDDAFATDNLDVIKLALTSESGDAGDTFEGIVIEWEEGVANTIMDAGIRINNLETTTATLTDAIKIESTGVDLGVTDAIDASDSNILNALNAGANVILGTTAVIDFTNFDVSTAGAVTAVGVNSGSGLIQGTGGLTNTGTVSINDNAGTNTTSIGGGSTTGGITIGGGSNALTIATDSWDVTAGAFSGITTLGLTGAITGQTGTDTINGLIINAGALSGATTIAATGTTTIGSGGNTFTFDPSAGPTYAGTAQPTKKITFSPEYLGATLTTFYGAGTDASITGTMTSDAETTTGDLLRNYYQWERTVATPLHYYTVAVRVTLPEDFSVWATTDAIVVDYETTDTSSANNLLDARIYLENNVTAVDLTSNTSLASGTANTWTSYNINASNGIDNDTGTDWDTAGQTAIIYLRMGSLNSNHVRVGDITLTYDAKF